ncbi:Golgi to endosome transport protein (Ent3) [Penicillium crustosum]|uniref:Golgi to endosome transport protein (Ent3) n=1 Tax=Penicillium crustosum TaxID=36656 RepID=UPI0023A76D00|nr:Golgi to endosome transport protein (Ent3) [Penicillium crustosum]KAJ5410162.1 Golgi to endosome transport protein (Ent3) [Penicillium crustosum]
MDFSNLKEQVSNMSLYDLKAGVRKVQNAVMNYTEMESKVREATNNEPWGASTTLMQDIANGTHSYQLLNEIMPLIYKRFTDKAAEEWRQIYKSLQLLEFLVKNGSERVVDDARSHMSLIRMLRQFHYIDMNGKDQGINVRNRSSELVKLLGDVDQIRTERKKAKNNRNKFSGFEGGMGAGSGMSSSGSGRYGGFGSDSMGYGGYSGGVYGDGGGFGGESGGQAGIDFQDTGRRPNRFEEYDEYDEGDAPARPREPAARAKPQAKKPEPAPAPVADLFDFGDDEPVTTTASTSAGKQPAGSALNILDPTPADDDDFDDFQSATPATQPTQSSNQFAIPPSNFHCQHKFEHPIRCTSANLGLAGGIPTPISQMAPMQQQKPSGYQAATPNYFTSVNVPQHSGSSHGATSMSSMASPTTANKPASAAAKKSSGDAFGSLWSTASASAGIQKSNTGTNKGPNLASMAKEKASAGIWGAPAPSSTSSTPSQPQHKQQSSSAFDDLLG